MSIDPIVLDHVVSEPPTTGDPNRVALPLGTRRAPEPGLPADWKLPDAWKPAHLELLLGLDELLLRADVRRPDSLAHLVLCDENALGIHAIQYSGLKDVRRWLERSAAGRVILPVCAAVCNQSLGTIGRLYGATLREPLRPEVADAKLSWLHAWRNYERGARELNGLVGAQIFWFLHEPLGPDGATRGRDI